MTPHEPTPAPSPAAGEAIRSTAGLVGFWDFAEPAGRDRVSAGTPTPHRLVEVNGPIARVDGGPVSGYAARLDGSQYFRLPHAEAGDLDLHGPGAAVSMIAFVRLDRMNRGVSVAGMWQEGAGRDDDTGCRQYALLLNMPTYGGRNQVTPHVSSEGGVTRRADGSGLPWCADYAASVSAVAVGEWVSVGFAYDGRWLRAFYNGVCEPREMDAAADGRDDRYFTVEGPGGGGRGMNPYYHGRGIFGYDPVRHAAIKPQGGSDFLVGARHAVGQMLNEALVGRVGGLAVFDRAIAEDEMAAMHAAAFAA